MARNVLQKNQSYADLGYRIDGRGIAYDLKTGAPMSRQMVDARIATAEAKNPNSDDYAARDRKRGGLAGAWDRNKAYIKPIASGLAGLIGTPALGALVGAAMGGFDREGKGGIGFDAKQGVMGGIAGYGAGTVGQGLGSLATKAGMNIGQGSLNKFGGSGLRSMFGQGASAAPAAAAPSAYSGTLAPEAVGDAYTAAGVAAPAGVPAAIAPASGVGGAIATEAPKTMLGKLGSSVAKNPTAYAMGLQGLGSLATSGSENRAMDATARRTAAEADKLEYENTRKAASDETLKELRARLAQQMMQLTGNPNTAATPYGGYRNT